MVHTLERDAGLLAVNHVQARTQWRDKGLRDFVTGVTEAATAAAHQGCEAGATCDRAAVQRAASTSAHGHRFARGDGDVATTAVVESGCFCHSLALTRIERDGIHGGAGGVDAFTDRDVAADGLDQHAPGCADAGRVDTADGHAVGVHIAQAANAGVCAACGQHSHIVVDVGQGEAAGAHQAQSVGHQFAIGALGHVACGGDHDAVVGGRGVASCRQRFVDGNGMPHQSNRALDGGRCADGDVAGVAGLAQRQATQIGHVVDGDVGHTLKAHQVVAAQGTVPDKVVGKTAAAGLNGQSACGVQGKRPCRNEFELVRAQRDARPGTGRDGGSRRGAAGVAVAAANGAAVQRLQRDARAAAGACGRDARPRKNHHGACRSRTRFCSHGQCAASTQHCAVAHKQAKQIA